MALRSMQLLASSFSRQCNVTRTSRICAQGAVNYFQNDFLDTFSFRLILNIIIFTAEFYLFRSFSTTYKSFGKIKFGHRGGIHKVGISPKDFESPLALGTIGENQFVFTFIILNISYV